MIHLRRKRLIAALIAGAVLGVVCILGANLRSDTALAPDYLFAFWYNRLLIGLVIGLAGAVSNIKLRILRGVILGFLVSFAFYSSTGYADLTGFLAGVIYGVIIEFVAEKFDTDSMT